MKFESNTFSKNASGIYRIKNLLDGKIYIGSTVNFYRRYTEHLSFLSNEKHPNRHLQFAYSKYGSSNFVFEVLESLLDKTKLLELEQVWINWSKCTDDAIGYNLSGIAGKIEHTDEVKRKISEANKGRPNKYKGIPRDPIIVEKIRQVRRDNPTKFSEESKQRMREAHAMHREIHLARLKVYTDAKIGYKQTDEERKVSIISSYKNAIQKRTMSDKDIVSFVKKFATDKSYTIAKWASEFDVYTTTASRVFKRLKSKNGDYQAVYKPILFKIGYIQSGATSALDLRKPEILAKLDLNIEFLEGSDNLINDPVELFNFIQLQD